MQLIRRQHPNIQHIVVTAVAEALATLHVAKRLNISVDAAAGIVCANKQSNCSLTCKAITTRSHHTIGAIAEQIVAAIIDAHHR